MTTTEEVSQERKNRIMQSITPRKGQSFQLPGTIVTLLAIAADTGDSFSLFEGRVAPQQGIPLHRHTDDEAFLVLEGTFHFQVEDQHLQLGPGGFAFIPKQTIHTFLNSSAEQEGRLLILTLPAGYHERFFAEVGEPKADPREPFSTQPPDLSGTATGFEAYGEPLQTAEGRAEQAEAVRGTLIGAAKRAGQTAVSAIKYGTPLEPVISQVQRRTRLNQVLAPQTESEQVGERAFDVLSAASGFAEGAAATGSWLSNLRAARAAAVKAPPISDELMFNNLLGVKATKSAVRVSSTGEITVSPAQALSNYTSPAKLAAMDPAHRVGFINGLKSEVGTQLAKTYEASNETIDLATPLRKVLNNIGEADLQTAANKQLTKILSDVEIADPSSVTPTQAWKLRQAIDAAGPDFWLNLMKDTRGTILRRLRGTISDALNDAVPAGQQLSRDYAGLVEADSAARQVVRKAAVTMPPAPEPPAPTVLQKLGQMVKDPRVWGPALGAAVGGRYGAGAVRKLSDLMGP